jgi:hypothetical protein
MECKMRSLNTKLVLSALRILTMLATPAFAQEPYRHWTGPTDPSGRGVYDDSAQSGFQSGVIPGYGVTPGYGTMPGYDGNGDTVVIPNSDYR